MMKPGSVSAPTTLEQAMIALNLLRAFSSRSLSPERQLDNPFRIQTWERHVNAAKTLLSRPETTAALYNIYQQAIALNPDDWVLARNASFHARRAPGRR